MNNVRHDTDNPPEGKPDMIPSVHTFLSDTDFFLPEVVACSFKSHQQSDFDHQKSISHQLIIQLGSPD